MSQVDERSTAYLFNSPMPKWSRRRAERQDPRITPSPKPTNRHSQRSLLHPREIRVFVSLFLSVRTSVTAWMACLHCPDDESRGHVVDRASATPPRTNMSAAWGTSIIVSARSTFGFLVGDSNRSDRFPSWGRVMMSRIPPGLVFVPVRGDVRCHFTNPANVLGSEAVSPCPDRAATVTLRPPL